MEEPILVCHRQSELSDPVEGSTTESCFKCQAKVWASQASLKKKEETSAKIACLQCVSEMAKNDPGPKVDGPSPDQMAEILNAMLNRPQEKQKMDLETFDQIYERFKETAVQAFSEDGNHPHLTLLIDPSGDVVTFPHDIFIGEILGRMGWKGPEEPEPELFGRAKDVAYGTVCKLAGERGSVGYVDISVAYALLPGPEVQPVKQFMDNFVKLKERWGGSIKNVPTRLRVLFMYGRFHEDCRTTIWKVNEQGKPPWATLFQEFKDKVGVEATTRAGQLDQIILENIAKEKNEDG